METSRKTLNLWHGTHLEIVSYISARIPDRHHSSCHSFLKPSCSPKCPKEWSRPINECPSPSFPGGFLSRNTCCTVKLINDTSSCYRLRALARLFSLSAAWTKSKSNDIKVQNHFYIILFSSSWVRRNASPLLSAYIVNFCPTRLVWNLCPYYGKKFFFCSGLISFRFGQWPGSES